MSIVTRIYYEKSAYVHAYRSNPKFLYLGRKEYAELKDESILAAISDHFMGLQIIVVNEDEHFNVA